MQSILERLFNGSIYPGEQIKIKLTGYQEARKVAIQAFTEAQMIADEAVFYNIICN